MGPGAVLVAGPLARRRNDQRACRDARGEARLPDGLAGAPVSRAGERLLRMADPRRQEAALQDSAQERSSVRIRGLVGEVGAGNWRPAARGKYNLLTPDLKLAVCELVHCRLLVIG